MVNAVTAPHIPQRLEPFEVEAIVREAKLRARENEGKADAAHYSDRTVLEPDLYADTMSLACERAVSKALNLYLPPGVWSAKDHGRFRHLPDVGINTEVKRVREPTARSFAIQRKDLDADRVMVACYVEELSMVRVLGWVRAVKAVDFTGTVWNDRGYWRAPLTVLGFIGHEERVVDPSSSDGFGQFVCGGVQ